MTARATHCRECKRPIVHRHGTAVFCSSACSLKWHTRNRKLKRKAK